jgi:hypothetical protein
MTPFAIVFNQRGDFAATNEAEHLLEAAGFAIGPSQRGAPRAVMFGNYTVAKWKNLNHDERRETHGTLTGDGREGPVTFRLLPAAPDDAVRAAEAVRLKVAEWQAERVA